MFEVLPHLAPDPILGLSAAFREDTNPNKIDLGVGVYKHFMLGLSVLALVSVRLVARIVGGAAPAIQPEPAKWQNKLATFVHTALYVFMFAMPIAGWLILSLAGKPIPFFGLELPPLASENKELGKTIKEIHETAGEVGYYVIGLHAAAALFHHYILADNTFKRMLFSKK